MCFPMTPVLVRQELAKIHRVLIKSLSAAASYYEVEDGRTNCDV